ncbi:hypothetical protein MRB53_039683 [Persea americana]|nr:hypothetical protein MRB53_039683 [Persea americana]
MISGWHRRSGVMFLGPGVDHDRPVAEQVLGWRLAFGAWVIVLRTEFSCLEWFHDGCAHPDNEIEHVLLCRGCCASAILQAASARSGSRALRGWFRRMAEKGSSSEAGAVYEFTTAPVAADGRALLLCRRLPSADCHRLSSS